MKTIRVAAAIIEQNGKIMIARRSYGDLAGFWEFPGGKYEEGETGEQAIKREISEEFDVEIDVKKYLCTVEHQYDFHLVMDCFICTLKSEEMILHDHSAIRWIDPTEENIDWCPVDRKVIRNYNALDKG